MDYFGLETFANGTIFDLRWFGLRLTVERSNLGPIYFCIFGVFRVPNIRLSIHFKNTPKNTPIFKTVEPT